MQPSNESDIDLRKAKKIIGILPAWVAVSGEVQASDILQNVSRMEISDTDY